MRSDAVGFFWSDITDKEAKKVNLLEEEGWACVFPGFWALKSDIKEGKDPRKVCKSTNTAYELAREAKTGVKAIPPEPTWKSPDYLPGLQEAMAFNIPMLTDAELIELSLNIYTKGQRAKFIYDIECYGNFFMIGLLSYETGKVTYLELSDDNALDCDKLRCIFEKFTMIGFNSEGYDIYIASMAAHGCTTAMMKSATTAIIEYQERGWNILRTYKCKKLQGDHIDIMEVAPLFASLKIYGGRMHTRRMQDLPFEPNTILNASQRQIVRWYCVNDLTQTLELFNTLKGEIELRDSMSCKYNIDLRSKSDAQIAEAIFAQEVYKLTGCRPHVPEILPGTQYRYNIPQFIQYATPLMNSVLNLVRNAVFMVAESGSIGLPEELKGLLINIGGSTYKLGIGGLHSTEKQASHLSGYGYTLRDRDVTSYYPFIIINQGLYPEHLGPSFLVVYRGIVYERVDAKHQGNKVVADSLKIVVNGSFGKFGSKHAIVYAPQLLIQTTITGQLCLLMLIERLELAGIPVVSANTDGIVIKVPDAKVDLYEQIIAQWEKDTSFETEETLYQALYSRDVNNYIAVKHKSTWKEGDSLDDRIKTKGIFATPGLSKNPQNQICVFAIKNLLLYNTPIRDTVYACNDISQFVNVRTVKGGAVQLPKEGNVGTYLGKAIRWYYAKDNEGRIVYALNGNKVPKSDGAQALMELPQQIPNNVDYEWYIKEANKMLDKMGYLL